MLRKLLNHVDVELTLEPREPLLIAAGVPDADGVDMPPVVTYRIGEQAAPYLPGSSLKGVLRSHAERVSRSLAAASARVCDPHRRDEDQGDRIQSCGMRLQEEAKQDGAEASALYQKSCPICRTFGSTVYRGRLQIGDAYAPAGQTPKTERRDGVGIDRFSGGASRGAKFEMRVVTQGTFKTRLHLQNFEDWQLGLLSLLCKDLIDGYIAVGHGTTRGLGRLGASIDSVTVSYVGGGGALAADRVTGVGALLGPAGAAYGYRADDEVPLTQALPLLTVGVRRQQVVPPEGVPAFLAAALQRWVQRMESWS